MFQAIKSIDNEFGLDVAIHANHPSEGFQITHMCIPTRTSGQPPFVVLVMEERDPQIPARNKRVMTYLERGDIVALQTQLSHMLGALTIAERSSHPALVTPSM